MFIPPFWGWTWSSPAVNELYFDVRTDEQRIFNLCKNFQRLIDYANFLADSINQVDSDLAAELDDAIDEMQAEFDAFRAEINERLNNLDPGALQWDVTQGLMTNTVTAMRNMLNFVTVHGVTVAELAASDFTVSTLSDCGLNCRGLAVYARPTIMNTDVPEGIYI